MMIMEKFFKAIVKYLYISIFIFTTVDVSASKEKVGTFSHSEVEYFQRSLKEISRYTPYNASSLAFWLLESYIKKCIEIKAPSTDIDIACQVLLSLNQQDGDLEEIEALANVAYSMNRVLINQSGIGIKSCYTENTLNILAKCSIDELRIILESSNIIKFLHTPYTEIELFNLVANSRLHKCTVNAIDTSFSDDEMPSAKRAHSDLLQTPILQGVKETNPRKKVKRVSFLSDIVAQDNESLISSIEKEFLEGKFNSGVWSKPDVWKDRMLDISSVVKLLVLQNKINRNDIGSKKFKFPIQRLCLSGMKLDFIHWKTLFFHLNKDCLVFLNLNNSNCTVNVLLQQRSFPVLEDLYVEGMIGTADNWKNLLVKMPGLQRISSKD